MKENIELFQIFPTPVLSIKYKEDISEETKYIENLKYTLQKDNNNFRSTDSYLFKQEGGDGEHTVARAHTIDHLAG